MSPVRLVTAVLAALAGTVVVLPSANAQEEVAEIELLAQPVWHDADDRLNLKLRITNTSEEELHGFNVVVGAS
jgi:hypothetical protein